MPAYQDSSIPTFERLEDSLRAAGVAMGASEAHGLMCGVMCASRPASHDWLGEILLESDAGDVHAEECRELLLAGYSHTALDLRSKQFDFHPLLPDDAAALDERSRALAEWCTGFLFGLNWAGVTPQQSHLPDDTREVLQDLCEFAGIRAGVEDCEAEERAFCEIVEYVRVGVMLISEELAVLSGSPAGEPVVH